MIQVMSELGAAGLIGMLWIMERRLAARRERQIDENHRRLHQQQQELEVWIDLVKQNIRAINQLEQTQRELITMLRRWRRRHTDAA